MQSSKIVESQLANRKKRKTAFIIAFKYADPRYLPSSLLALRIAFTIIYCKR
jgi:hypothetical protein